MEVHFYSRQNSENMCAEQNDMPWAIVVIHRCFQLSVVGDVQ